MNWVIGDDRYSYLYYASIWVECHPEPICGNLIKEPGEECEIHNRNIGCDGCKAKCGWKCPFPDIWCVKETCGNGVIDWFELFDDGNNIDGDSCPYNCFWNLD